MSFRFGRASQLNLKGVHEDLRQVAELAIKLTNVDFAIVEGVRTIERQELLVEQKRSKTMNSRHITGDAFDFCPYLDGSLVWNNLTAFQSVVDAMFEAADRLGILIQSGSDWDMDGIRVDKDSDENFLDFPHIQRPWPYRVKRAEAAQKRRVKARELDEEDVDTDPSKLPEIPPAPRSISVEERLSLLESRVSRLETE